MPIIPIVAGAFSALVGLVLIVRPQISHPWRHPEGQPLPHWTVRAVGLLLLGAGAWAVVILAGR